MFLIVGDDTILGMDTHCGQGGDLVQMGVVALTGMTVEGQLGHITTGIGGSHVTYLPEPSGTRDIGIRHLPDHAFLLNQIEGQGVHEVGRVRTLKHAQSHTFRT